MVLSNSAWGTIELDAEGRALSWTCQWSQLTTEQPMTGLQTYTECSGFGDRCYVSPRFHEGHHENRSSRLWSHVFFGGGC